MPAVLFRVSAVAATGDRNDTGPRPNTLVLGLGHRFTRRQSNPVGTAASESADDAVDGQALCGGALLNSYPDEPSRA